MEFAIRVAFRVMNFLKKGLMTDVASFPLALPVKNKVQMMQAPATYKKKTAHA
jgi:hypothetical protein